MTGVPVGTCGRVRLAAGGHVDRIVGPKQTQVSSWFASA